MKPKMQTYKNIPRLLAGLTLLCISSFAMSFELTPFSLNLEAKRYGTVDVTLDGIQTLSNLSDNQWQYNLQTLSSFIKVIETSKFVWENNDVLPISYRSYNRIAFVKTVDNATFDHKFKEITVKRKKNKKIYPLKAGIMDPNSFQIKMMQELSQGKKSFSYKIQQMGSQTDYDFRVLQHEVLNTSMGQLDTLKIEQVWKTKSNKEKYFWVSENFGYIPILIENYNNGKIESSIRVTGGIYGGKAIKAAITN